MLIPVVLGSSFIVFCIVSAASGDITTIVAADASEEEMDAIRDQYNLNDPLLVQYGKYLFNLVQGDLGKSYYNNVDVFEEYMSRFPNTLKLASAATLLGILIALPIGILSAIKQYTMLDYSCIVFALIGISMPVFWEGLLLILLFSLKLELLPSGGYDNTLALILPAITSGTHIASTVTRMTRSSMLEVTRQDYIQTARAKGLPEHIVILKHALGNAMIPILTSIGIAFGTAVGGAVVAESIFTWPGVGRLVVEAIHRRDTPLVLGCIIMTTILVSMINLLVDILYAFFDPRIKAQYKGA